MANQLDGVIEAVRYKNGQIVSLRVYERRGATYSDHVLIDRKTLVERLQRGKRYAVGTREEFRASTFNLGRVVMQLNKNGRELIATNPQAESDELEGAPIF